MAGEKAAKLYEAITAWAVKRAVSDGALGELNVAREVQIAGINIRSDVVAQDVAGRPRLVFLVTHSRISVHWAEKFKRDAAEFIELATSELSIQGIYLVVFDDRTLPAFERIAEGFFSAIVRVPRIRGGEILQGLSSNEDFLRLVSGLDQDDVLEAIEKLANENHEVRGALATLSIAIKKVLPSAQDAKLEHGTFFALTKAMVAARRKGWIAPPERHTRFNRGISKLALFDLADWSKVAGGSIIKGGASWGAHPIYWQQSSGKKGPLTSRAIGGFRCIDPEIIGGTVGSEAGGYAISSIFESLSVTEIKGIVDRGIQPMMARYSARIRAEEVLLSAVDYIHENISSLVRKDRLFKLLMEVSADPDGSFRELCGRSHSAIISWNWLFAGVVALLKGSIGKKQGFGYSKIAARMVTPKYQSSVEHSILQNFEYCLKDVSEPLLREVGASLASYLKELEVERISDLRDAALKFFLWTEVEDKAIPHGIDVLPAMIELAAERQRLPFSKSSITGCLAQALESSSTVGRTNVFRFEDTAVWYKAGHYRSNILHKRKEVQTTVAAWRQEWAREAAEFRVRHSLKGVVLVLDGDWLPEDLELLHLYGVDHFLYADQLDSLGNLIE